MFFHLASSASFAQKSNMWKQSFSFEMFLCFNENLRYNWKSFSFLMADSEKNGEFCE